MLYCWKAATGQYISEERLGGGGYGEWHRHEQILSDEQCLLPRAAQTILTILTNLIILTSTAVSSMLRDLPILYGWVPQYLKIPQGL